MKHFIHYGRSRMGRLRRPGRHAGDGSRLQAVSALLRPVQGLRLCHAVGRAGRKGRCRPLNAKGGIEGHAVEMMLQDHGNQPQRGVECSEKLKRDGVMVFDMLSTPVSRAVLPRA